MRGDTMSYPWEVGDRVVSTVDRPDGNSNIRIGSTGTVCAIRSRIGVCWDDDVDGHDCETSSDGPHCEHGYGWWVDAHQIEPETEDDGVAFEFDESEFNKLVFGAG